MPGRSLLPPPRGGQKLAPGQGGAAWQRISPALPPCGGPLIRPATRDSSTGPLLATAAPHAAAPARVRPQRQCWQARAAAAAHAARSAAAAADCTTPPRPAAARFAPPLRPLPPAAGLCGSGALHPAARSKVPGGLWGRAAARLSTRPGLSGAHRPTGRFGLAYARRSGRRAWLGHAAALAQARRLGSCCPCVRLGGGPARSI